MVCHACKLGNGKQHVKLLFLKSRSFEPHKMWWEGRSSQDLFCADKVMFVWMLRPSTLLFTWKQKLIPLLMWFGFASKESP